LGSVKATDIDRPYDLFTDDWRSGVIKYPTSISFDFSWQAKVYLAQGIDFFQFQLT
jgi:hypothetical protein